MLRASILMALPLIILPGALGCSLAAPPEEPADYDVTGQFTELVEQIDALQSQIDEARIIKAENEKLNTQYEDLKEEHAQRLDELQSVKEELNELNRDYIQLEAQYQDQIAAYEALSEEFEAFKGQYVATSEEFDDDAIEDGLFALMNEERETLGAAPLDWRLKHWTHAKQNNEHMAEIGDYTYYQYEAYPIQEVFWATGYDTTEEIINAALTTWRNNVGRYQNMVLNTYLVYGAIDAYQFGDIIYITYIGSFRP